LGFLAALAAGRGDLPGALALLALAGLADTMAGRVAHGWHLESEIGAELDSLASLLVWGVAASLLAYNAGLRDWGAGGVVIASLAALGAAWRLCKGDLQSNQSGLRGLPLPLAGALLCTAVAFGAGPGWLAGLVLVLVSAQMLPLRYPRPAVPLLVAMPLLLSLGLAAFGIKWGWALPGLAALVWGTMGPFFAQTMRARA
jgi:CDP-diacylglycerol--serine O-phosphatidyltransferase